MAFSYPSSPYIRRHGPRGYRNYRSYKPWLRDEFDFRCAYCLWRERWCANGDHEFGVDHILPQTTRPEHINDYDNLIYACNVCNAFKQEVAIAVNPCEEGLGHHLEIQSDGRVHALTERGAEQIALCRLNRPRLRELHRMMMEMLRLLESTTNEEARQLLEFLLDFPDNLPRLSALRPPDGNARSDSVVNSYDEKRRRGELPATY
jgi:hypothetical protein